MVVQLGEVRSALERARQAAVDGDTHEAASDIDAALALLDGDLLLTPRQAANVIGIEEPLIVTVWCHQGKLRCENAGNEFLVPQTEAARFRETDEVGRMRWSDAAHAASAELGWDRPLTEEEMDFYFGSSQGNLPWHATASPWTKGECRRGSSSTRAFWFPSKAAKSCNDSLRPGLSRRSGRHGSSPS